MNRISCLALSLLLFVPLACRKDEAVDTSDVDPIAQKILNAIAQGDARSVYDTYFTPEYKSDMTPKEWNDLVAGYRELFGNVTSVKRLNGSAKWVGGQFVDGEVAYNVTWEKGIGEMTLDVTKEEGWKVRQIKIASPQIDERVDKLATELTTEPAN